MFRIKRTRWISLGLVLAVLLLPLPASAGSLWETARGWEGAWTGLLDWIGPVAVELSCVMIDPNGCPGGQSTAPSPPVTESCAAIDPNGCPGGSGGGHS